VQHGQTGFHTPPRDPEALAVRICTLLTHAELRQRLGTQARLHAQQYDWSYVVQRMIREVYTPLYGEPAPAPVRPFVLHPHPFAMRSKPVAA
jgi:glycosyltransferase involved in cell wall biosynthesis